MRVGPNLVTEAKPCPASSLKAEPPGERSTTPPLCRRTAHHRVGPLVASLGSGASSSRDRVLGNPPQAARRESRQNSGSPMAASLAAKNHCACSTALGRHARLLGFGRTDHAEGLADRTQHSGTVDLVVRKLVEDVRSVSAFPRREEGVDVKIRDLSLAKTTSAPPSWGARLCKDQRTVVTGSIASRRIYSRSTVACGGKRERHGSWRVDQWVGRGLTPLDGRIDGGGHRLREAARPGRQLALR